MLIPNKDIPVILVTCSKQLRNLQQKIHVLLPMRSGQIKGVIIFVCVIMFIQGYKSNTPVRAEGMLFYWAPLSDNSIIVGTGQKASESSGIN